MSERRTLSALAFACLLLTACGGGGGGGSPSTGGGGALPPSTPAPDGWIALSVSVPPAPAGSKHPLYVSPGTDAVRIVDSSSSGTATYLTACTDSVCSYQYEAAPGAHGLAVQLLGGTSQVLSMGSTSTTVVSEQIDHVTLTFNPVVASMHVQYVSSAPSIPADIPLKVVAQDAAGYTIIGSDSFVDGSGVAIHITLTDDDASGHTSLGPGTISAAADAVTLHYDGSPHTTAILKATATGSVPVGNGAFASIGTDRTSGYGGTGHPTAATVGPDGDLWMTGWASAGFDVVRMAPDGTQTVFNVPSYAIPPPNPGLTVTPPGIVAADGDLWVPWSTGGSTGNLERVTTAGATTAVTDQALAAPSGIAAGADGDLWVPSSLHQSLASVTPSGTVTGHSMDDPAEPVFLDGGLRGSDGRLYFVNGATNRIDAFDTSSLGRTEYTPPAGVSVYGNLVLGSDGNVWFVCGTNSGGCIGDITPAGAYATYPVPGAVTALARGVDGQIWFTDASFGLRWLNASGDVGGYPLPLGSSGSADLLAVDAGGSFVAETVDARGVPTLHALPF